MSLSLRRQVFTIAGTSPARMNALRTLRESERFCSACATCFSNNGRAALEVFELHALIHRKAQRLKATFLLHCLAVLVAETYVHDRTGRLPQLGLFLSLDTQLD